ncbi:DUF58 domain-containing protein [Ruania alba]|uniref:DUF58 domain-containing protein n=1 Tax=Ruania alba TaxID=648782 RepID=A0A1H5E8R1_9MICO|nr:DUF58 domain-containing protein [Ruania alba]SED87542.1 Protein of unknown function DUF58 [Ruania alba]
MRPTARGAGLLLSGLALAFLATAMRSPVIATLAALALMTPLVSVSWLIVRRAHGQQVSLRRQVTPVRPTAGDTVRVAPQITSGTLDAWTSLRERIPGALHRGSTDASGYTLRPPMRGTYELGPATLVHTDPLILARGRSTARGTDELLVWPVVADVSALVRLWADHQSVHTENGRPERAPDDLTLREYQPGDDMHRVHWRASARHGELLTRQDEPAQDRTASIVLDLGPAEDPRSDSPTEWLVSTTASLSVALIEAGYRLHLTLAWTVPGTHTDGANPGDPERSGTVSLGDTGELLDLFARARFGAPHPEPMHRGLAIAALRSPTQETVRTLTTWTGNRLALVVDGSPEVVERLADAGWVVHTVEAGTPADETWSTLLGAMP